MNDSDSELVAATGNPAINTVDDYINAQSPEIAERLRLIRDVFHKVIPQTEESMRYNMPAFTVGGDHLYMSAYKNHIGMYPMYGIPDLDGGMLAYRGKGTKDALHFKHSEPLPIALIQEIIKAKALLALAKEKGFSFDTQAGAVVD